MKKKSRFTKNAVKILTNKNADKHKRVICQVDGNEIYLSNGIVVYKMLADEYETIFKRSLGFEFGNWTYSFISGKKTMSKVDIANCFAECNYNNISEVKKFPMTFDCSHTVFGTTYDDYRLAVFSNKNCNVYINDLYSDLFNDAIYYIENEQGLDPLEFSKKPIIVSNDTVCGLIFPYVPSGLNEYESIKRAVNAWNNK